MTGARLANGIEIDSRLRELDRSGIFYYLLQRGEYFSGTLLVKIATRDGACLLRTRQRDEKGDLVWIDALAEKRPDEAAADAFIARARSRDPDLWIVEVEDRTGRNPFES
jgi:hypothetical protein